MRLRDLYTGGLTWRELISYVRGLSPQAATRTALNAGIPEPSGEQIVLADLIDTVNALDWHFRQVNTAEKAPKAKPAKPYPRWWEPKPDTARRTAQRVARLEDARRRKRAREQAIAEGRIA
ncbi:hypothetical protein ACQKFA_23260 [Streptomyces sp. CH6]|uniref:hypothetical protein n=1 Tax=Streptomyces sp. CH6 TaxID=3420320 RepID=UPI003CFC4138